MLITGYMFIKNFRTRFIFWCAFITWSILGSYTRVGLVKLSDYDQAYIRPTTYLWPNCVATIIMGIVQGLKPYNWVEKYMFTCLTTGYAGTASSFSSLTLEVFLNSSYQYVGAVKFPNGGYGIMGFISTLLVQMFVSMTSLLFGIEISKLVAEQFKFSIKNGTSVIPKIFNFIYIFSAVIGPPLLIVHVALAIKYQNSSIIWTLTAIFGVIGASVRYELSNYCNSLIPSFPIGTFLANIFATTGISILYLAQRGQVPPSTRIVKTVINCRIIEGLMNGICSGLSTTSTMINEGYRLPFSDTLRYFAVTIALAYSICVVTVGAMAWTNGLVNPLC